MRLAFSHTPAFHTSGSLGSGEMARHIAAIAASDPVVAASLRDGTPYRIRIEAQGEAREIWGPRPPKTVGGMAARETLAAYRHVIALARPAGHDHGEPATAAVTLHPVGPATLRAIAGAEWRAHLRDAVRVLRETGFPDADAIAARIR